ncbi:MAG: glycoside hydrolase family 31 protein [Anaerolineae bacterium]|nr:glycoside hydrolase family 31 protein [Anaerolineae bacterium]
MRDEAIIKATRAEENTTPEVAAYEKEIAELHPRFADRVPKTGAAQSTGGVKKIIKTERGAVLHLENGQMHLTYWMPDLLEVRVTKEAAEPYSYAVEKREWAAVEPVIIEDKQSVVVGAGFFACNIDRTTGHFSIYAPDGTALIANSEEGFQWMGDGVRWTRQLPEDEWCYGMGQRSDHLNLRGNQYTMRNADPFLYKRGDDPCYYSIPFYFGFQNKYALGIFWDNPAQGKVDLGKTTPEKMSFEAVMGEAHFYFMASLVPDTILDRYTSLTGRPYMPPLWALGYHQSRWGYENADQFRTLASEFRRRKIPCDVLHYDIDYMDGSRCFTWNEKNFPDLPGLIKELRGQGFKSVAILDPGIKLDPNFEIYRDGKQKGVFVTYPDGTPYRGVVWPGMCEFPDFSAPESRSWWAEKVAAFVQKTGFAGVWNDMNEPTVFMRKGPGTFPDYVRYHGENGQPFSHAEGGNNLYGMQMARATRAGLEQAIPDERPFTFTRTGYAGIQRYASSWTGDNLSTWDHLRLSISMLMNLGLSGIPFSGPDVGGFGDAPDGELYTRWIQLGSVLPFFRTHSTKESPAQEPWSFGPQFEPIIRRYIELRYQLLPYFYSVMAMANQKGMPFLRPGFFHDRNDPYLRAQDDAFLVGDSLFVAPILEPGAAKRMVYLPRGAWYNYWTNKLIDGARHIEVEGALDTMPMFVRAGHTIPQWPVQQYVGEKKLDQLTIRVYAGPGETTLYEDSGTGSQYLEGEYRYSYFTCGFLPGGRFGISWRTAGRYKPPYEAVRVRIVGVPGEPNDILIDEKPAPVWFFEHGVLEVLSPSFRELALIGRRAEGPTSAQTAVRRPVS